MSKRKNKDRFQGKPLLAEVAFFSGDDEACDPRVFDLAVHSNWKKLADAIVWGLLQGHEMEIVRKGPKGGQVGNPNAAFGKAAVMALTKGTGS